MDDAHRLNENYTILRRRREIPTETLPNTVSDNRPDNAALYEAVRSLPESLRTPFLLKYMEGMTEKEAAAAMGLALPCVKNRLFRARKKLQDKLNEEVDA